MGSKIFWLRLTTATPLSVWPHLFRSAGHEKRRGEQLKWSLAFRLYIGTFTCAQLPGPVHTARLLRVVVSEMTYTVSNGTLNSTIAYHTILQPASSVLHLSKCFFVGFYLNMKWQGRPGRTFDHHTKWSVLNQVNWTLHN